MAEPGNELTTGAGGQGRLRASHADREQVIDALKAAFVQGRLDRDEFDLRVGRALASRTYADLAALTADIPARLARARPPEPARESVSKTAVVATACGTAALIGMWPVMMRTPPWPAFVLPVALVWFVLVMAVPTCWLVLLHDWLAKRSGRQSASGLPPGAGGAASRRPAPADLASMCCTSPASRPRPRGGGLRPALTPPAHPAHARGPLTTAQPAMPSATTPSGHRAPKQRVARAQRCMSLRAII